jgi:hypothetical protein
LAARLKQQQEQRAAEQAAKQVAQGEPAVEDIKPVAKQSALAKQQKQQQKPLAIAGKKRMAPTSPEHGKR